jgi:tetratricopeptide (TPR) repeat protein
MLSFAVQYHFSKDDPFPYRLVNIILHMLNVLILYLLLVHLRAPPLLALGTSLIFGVHPVHVEAVAAASGRAGLLSAGATLTACLLYLRRSQNAVSAGTALSLGLCFFLGLATKEDAVMIPVIIFLLYAFFPQGTEGVISSLSFRQRVRKFFTTQGRLIFFFALAFVVFIILRAIAVESNPFSVRQAASPFDNPLALMPLSMRILGALRIAGQYFRRLLWPSMLSPDYSYDAIPMSFTFRDIDLYLTGLFLIGAVTLLWRWRKSQPLYAWSGMFFLTTYFPVSNLAVPIGTLMGDRLIYLPSVASCLFLAAAIMHLAQFLPGPPRIRTAASCVVIATIALVYSGIYLSYSTMWKNNETLFNYAARVFPRSYKIQFALGNLYIDRDPKEALIHYTRAFQIAPQDTMIHFNMATALYRLGRYRDAEPFYLSAVKGKLSWPYLHYDLGNLYLQLGRYREAAEYYRLFLENNPPDKLDARERILWALSAQRMRSE